MTAGTFCSCKAEDTTGKGPGPDGNATLCAVCTSRWRAGHTGPPVQNEDGRYPCERCGRTFETFSALGVHGRNCDGGSWRCAWCSIKADASGGKSPGPDGPRTLCSNCGGRYRSGATGPAKADAFGLYPCEFCGKQFETIAGLGGHRRFCSALK